MPSESVAVFLTGIRYPVDDLMGGSVEAIDGSTWTSWTDPVIDDEAYIGSSRLSSVALL